MDVLRKKVVDIAFVGAGASAVANLLAFLKKYEEQPLDRPITIGLIDPRASDREGDVGRLGRGDPYDIVTSGHRHTLRAKAMGVAKDVLDQPYFPSDFVTWLIEKQPYYKREIEIVDSKGIIVLRRLIDFTQDELRNLQAPRDLYGDYLEERLLQAIKKAERMGIQVFCLKAKVQGLHPGEENRVRIELENDSRINVLNGVTGTVFISGELLGTHELETKSVVLAPGFHWPKRFQKITDRGLIFQNPASEKAYAHFREKVWDILEKSNHPRVLVAGAMNSGIDGVLFFEQAVREFREHHPDFRKKLKVMMASRSGYRMKYHDQRKAEGYQRKYFTYQNIMDSLIGELTISQCTELASQGFALTDKVFIHSTNDSQAHRALRTTVTTLLDKQDRGIVDKIFKKAIDDEKEAIGSKEMYWIVPSEIWIPELTAFWGLLDEPRRRIFRQHATLWNSLDTSVPEHIHKLITEGNEYIELSTIETTIEEEHVQQKGDHLYITTLDLKVDAMIDALGAADTHPLIENSTLRFVRDPWGGIDYDRYTHQAKIEDEQNVIVAGIFSGAYGKGYALQTGNYIPHMTENAQRIARQLVTVLHRTVPFVAGENSTYALDSMLV